MYYNPTTSAFFSAISELLLSTGEIDRNTEITTETLDRALRAYIHKVIDEHNYLFGNDYDA